MIKKFLIVLTIIFSQHVMSAGVEVNLSVDIKRLTLDAALIISKAAINACRVQGVQIGVVVVDRGGNVQVAMRDTLATDMTLTIAEQKAYAALSFNSVTSKLTSQAKTALVELDGLMLIGGGVPVQAGGHIYGAVGVSGAAKAEVDENCAEEGVKSVIEDLEME